MKRLTAIREADGEAGFTLVELLVTMIAGIVVLMATFGVLDLSMRQNARATDRVQTTQIGRSAMERLVQELHSSCAWATATPVQVGSGGNTLWFISQFSSATVPSPVLHKVTLNGTILSDTTYALSVPAGTTDTTGWLNNPANWTFANFNTATATGYTNLITNVYPTGTNTGLFQYYQYVNGQIAIDSTHLLTAPLTAATAPTVGEVTIGMSVRPADGSTEADRAINLNDAAVVAAPPTNGASQCQL
jgi:Tfp pilus assembly protein PilV